MRTLDPLHRLHEQILQQINAVHIADYQAPALWENDLSTTINKQIDPYLFWSENIEWVLNMSATPLDHEMTTSGEWSQYAVIYNLFLRSATAFDHDQDGTLGRPNPQNLSETGTFMKAICLLPYIKSIGCNTIHLLPITSIGHDGNKGDAGSPYAIRNPYQLDENLAEPSLGLGVEAEFAAFVAAAHHLGLRVVLEFVFRTSSKDADVVAEHPEWFYWISTDVADRTVGSDSEEAYGMPIFSAEEVNQIKQQVERENFVDLTPPHPIHQAMFLPKPERSQVALRDGRWIATYPDGREGRIPGAFADWPVDDKQPPWGDVTYLRLYDHPEFNYIAYNTIRMYDERLAQPENVVQPLWDYIINIIPHYQTAFGIDGAMMDMGHALPTPLKQQLVAAARALNPNFAFWDENFVASAVSVEEGYNAVMGYLPFVMHKPSAILELIDSYCHNDSPLPMFGALENHNTPRASARPNSQTFIFSAVAIACFLPTVPFVHCGVEFGETEPVNTGLDFSAEELARYASDQLPLFSVAAYNWATPNLRLLKWWRKTLELRSNYLELVTDLRHETIGRIQTSHPHIHGILRRTPDWSQKLALLFNTDPEHAASVWLHLPTGRAQLCDYYTGELIPCTNSWIEAKLGPGQCWWLEL